MSKNRREWYEAIMFIASLILVAAIMVCVGMPMRGMDIWWTPALVLLAVCGSLYIIALIIHEGRDLLALPQAIRMAMQDRRKRNGMRNMQDDNHRRTYCRHCGAEID